MLALWVAWNGCGDRGRERSEEDGVSLWRGGPHGDRCAGRGASVAAGRRGSEAAGRGGEG